MGTKLPEVPDLLVPTTPTSSRAPVSGPQPSAAPKPVSNPNDADDVFGGGIEHGMAAMPPSGASAQHRGKALSVDFGHKDDDDFGDSLERGAGSSLLPAQTRGPTSMPSAAPNSGVSRPPVSRGPASLDVAYRRSNDRPAPAAYEPPLWEKLAARVVPALGFAAAFAPLVKYVHHAGQFNLLKLLPRAFDASSTVLSGVMSGVMLVASITVGFLALRRRNRSYAMVFSAALFLITCLAMVTVTLVSTDEAPQPPDGARLVPYLVPAALVLLGLGTMGRGIPRFLRGRAVPRLLSFVFGVLGGLIAYAGLALSSW